MNNVHPIFREILNSICPQADRNDADLMSEAQEFPRWQEVGGELVRGLPLDYDPTPWCSGCGAMKRKDCHCGPIADNE